VKHPRVVKVSEVMGLYPQALGDSYASRLLIESEGVGSSRLMLVHATLKPGRSPGEGAAHPAPYDEAYYVLRGQGRMEFGDEEDAYDVGPDTAIFIPAGVVHKITNTGSQDLEFLTIWPLTPADEGINGVYDERNQRWGTNFRLVSEPAPDGDRT
jgi:mannose-6-phosphate isomerase-like protein (cupin superfamily)